MGRKEDLENNIRESYALINEYEAIQRDTDWPKERKRVERIIDEQWGLIEGYANDYFSLCEHLQVSPEQDLIEILARFSESSELPLASQPSSDTQKPSSSTKSFLPTTHAPADITDYTTESHPLHILHISDIHRAPDAPTTNNTLLGKLLDDIRHTYEEDNARLDPGEPQLGSPDLILISGDLTQRAEESEYEIALEFLEGLLPLVDDDRKRVILVPGNHDLNWAITAQSYTQATRTDYDNQPPPGEPYRQSVKRAPDGTYWRKNEATYTERFKPFKTLFDSFYQGTLSYSLARDHMFTIYDLSESLGIVVVGFNSSDEIDAYMHDGKLSSLDRRAFINTDAIYNAQQSPVFHADQPELLRIAVFHHNIRSVSHREDFLDPRYLQILKRHGFDLCLHGHVHTPSHDLFDATQAPILPVVGAGSLAAPYSDRPPASPMGYNIVTIDRQSGGIWVHVRRHDEDHLVWAADYQAEWDGKPYFVVRTPSQQVSPTSPESAATLAAIRSKLTADKDEKTLEALRQLEEHPADEKCRKALAEILIEKAQEDPEFAQELRQLTKNEPIAQFLTQVYDDGCVQKIINIAHAGVVHID